LTSISHTCRVLLRPLAKGATLTHFLLVAVGCGVRESETLRFSHGSTDIEVTFRGEVADSELFGPEGSLLDHVHPIDGTGRRQGKVSSAKPGWLRFEYQLNGERREVLVAKKPLLSHVSWQDIARAGAALADDSAVAVGGGSFAQGARMKDARGNEYRIRLPTCGRSTLADLSEWNLLIGAVHRGDMDFSGAHYGWITHPYDDSDLKVGYHGSLSWCQETLRSERVARGYFFVSRFHAADADLRTERLHWRPVLERVKVEPAPLPLQTPDQINSPIRWSPSRRVGFAGTVGNAELFGSGVGVGELVPVQGGEYVRDGRPDWLRFLFHGKTLLVAANPIKRSVSWDAIAQAGAALGDGSNVRVGWRSFRQDAEVKDLAGRRYRVRLLTCGRSTLDLGSEWSALMGGIHRGDGDFLPYPLGTYGWLTPSFDDHALSIGVAPGSATWCQERIELDGKAHGVNRGYLTISRFHATETAFTGSGFGWRPVLEQMP
jgi:hypothetical protein